VIACQGGNMAGWSLYLDDSWSTQRSSTLMGHVQTTIARFALDPGAHTVMVLYNHDGGSGRGTATLSVDGAEVR